MKTRVYHKYFVNDCSYLDQLKNYENIFLVIPDVEVTALIPISTQNYYQRLVIKGNLWYTPSRI